MSESKETVEILGLAAPFRRSSIKGSDDASRWIEVYSADGKRLCSVLDESLTETQMNHAADLFAAAPDLLAALKFARRFLKPEDCDTAYIDAAIARAQGTDE
jgi:hypothetical protein